MTGDMMNNVAELTKLMESSGMMDEMQEQMEQSGGSLSLGDHMLRFGDRFTETLSKAAAEGNTAAQQQLACAYEMGSGGVEKDEKKALEYYTKAHEGGNIAATHDLALCYLNGTGVKRYTKKAVELFTQAAEAVFVLSQSSLGNWYLNGEGVKKNEKVGFSWVKKAALKGDMNAQYMLAKCYAYGSGTSEDQPLAVKYLEKAAKQGDTESTYYLGVACENWLGVPQDFAAAFDWYRKCANMINKATRQAKYNLGVFCLHKVTPDARKSDAVEWFEESGNTSSMYALGVMHRAGNGVRKDEEKAKSYFLQVFQMGYMPGMVALRNSRLANKITAVGTRTCLCDECDHF
ncbi:hypothetical protein HDU98_004644 [Podochytrium sp. JEL0797]|nr:hypothetical protein HDU98_004644 [Podochytrium sp. JEL0797]